MQLLKFDLFKNFNILHCFSTRNGGFSEGPFQSLNLGLSTHDNKVRIKENREAFFNHLNINTNHLAIPQQIHSANIEIADKAGIYHSTDALITDKKGIILTIQTADCFPVFVFDPQKDVIAIIHSGWRGTAQNIVGKSVRKMIEIFSCKSSDILVAIGPGIQQENYQVDIKTAGHFEKEFLKSDGKDHYMLDIQGKINSQLIETGVKCNHIEYDTRCTFENKDLFYSYRRDGQNSGRMMGLISLL